MAREREEKRPQNLMIRTYEGLDQLETSTFHLFHISKPTVPYKTIRNDIKLYSAIQLL